MRRAIGADKLVEIRIVGYRADGRHEHVNELRGATGFDRRDRANRDVKIRLWLAHRESIRVAGAIALEEAVGFHLT